MESDRQLTDDWFDENDSDNGEDKKRNSSDSEDDYMKMDLTKL